MQAVTLPFLASAKSAFSTCASAAALLFVHASSNSGCFFRQVLSVLLDTPTALATTLSSAPRR